MLEAAISIFAICLLMFMMLQLSLFCLGVLSGFDAANSAVRSGVTYTGTWSVAALEPALRDSHVVPLFNRTQPIKVPSAAGMIQAVGINDANAVNQWWGTALDSDAQIPDAQYPYLYNRPRDRQGWLHRMNIKGQPASVAASERIRNIDYQIRFQQPMLFFKHIFGASFDIVTDMGMTRYKDSGVITTAPGGDPTGFVDHRTRAFPGAFPW